MKHTRPSSKIAYCIHTPRLVVRCWHPTDAPLLHRAICESLDHLQEWMPWAANEPQDVPARVEILRQFRGKFDLGYDFTYGIFNRDQTLVLGGTGLHPRVGEGAYEIGYWIHAHHINQGLATEVSAALTRVAFEVVGANRVEIHCSPHNLRSARVPQKLGFIHEATLRDRVYGSKGQLQDSMIWTMFSDHYPGSIPSGSPIEAFDVLGQKLI